MRRAISLIVPALLASCSRRVPWPSWCRRNPAVASLVALAFVLLVTVAAVSTLFAIWAGKAERQRRLELVQALQDRAHAGRLSRRPDQRYASLDALAQAAQLARELKPPPERRAPGCRSGPNTCGAESAPEPPAGCRRPIRDQLAERDRPTQQAQTQEALPTCSSKGAPAACAPASIS